METVGAEDRLRAALQKRACKIAVMGLGYVGLPMAVEFARAGFEVVGIEIDARRRRKLANGESYIEGLADTELTSVLADGGLEITADMAAPGRADVVLICVPTPLCKSQEPDISAIVDAGEAIADHLHAGQLVVLESTTYPGTTREVLLPLLEQSGLQVGKDFFLAFSPERIDPANKRYNVSNIPKLVGGVTAACGTLAAELYRQIVSAVVPVSCPRVAEAAKLLENTYRSVNIALANEMAIICRNLGIDAWEVNRRGGDQAVRVHAPLSGAGNRRSLHSSRSAIPGVEIGTKRLRAALYSIGGGDQPGHAFACRRSGRTGAPGQKPSFTRQQDTCGRRGLQAGCGATAASRRAWRSSACCNAAGRR